MARTETVTVKGQDFILQSVSPSWYLNLNDTCGMTGDRKDTARYMDHLFKNCVIVPEEVKVKGIKYFDEREDLETAEALIGNIERFLRPGTKREERTPAGKEE